MVEEEEVEVDDDGAGVGVAVVEGLEEIHGEGEWIELIALDSNFEGFALYKTKEWTIM